MDKFNDGGPAFPETIRHMGPAGMAHEHEGGMTLRDYFAAKALQGWITLLGDCIDEYENEPEAFKQHQESVAETCYSYADAMLKARANHG